MKFLLPQVFKDFFRNLKWQTREELMKLREVAFGASPKE